MGPLLFQYTVSYNFSDICIHVKYMQYLNKGWEALLKTGILSLLLNFIIVCAQRKPCAKHKLTVCMGRVFFLGYFHGQAQLERGICAVVGVNKVDLLPGQRKRILSFSLKSARQSLTL